MYSTVDLCLLCLTYNENQKSILSQDNEGIFIEEKCRYILNENVYIRPELSYICLHCMKNLSYVYKFKQMCLKNIKTFNNYVDTLETNNHLKLTLADLQYQKMIEQTFNNESANEISLPIEVVLIKEEIADNFVLQDGDVLEGEEAMETNDEFSTIENPENINNNMQYGSSLCEEVHIKNFLNRVKKEVGCNLIHEEIQVKDECSDSEDISNNKLLNEGTNKPDCNSTFSDGGKNKVMDQNVDCKKRRKYDKRHEAFSYPSDYIHTGERPFKCTTCKERFCYSTDLITHARMHIGPKTFKCDMCNKKFVRRKHLIIHERSHNNDRPFKCSVCDKAFTDNSNMTVHMRIHTGEKPFQCQICQYKCARVDRLKVHMQIHTGEKPFHCQVCQYKSAQAGDLRRHMRIHTGDKPFKCKLCKKAFSCGLTRHMRTHHTNKN